MGEHDRTCSAAARAASGVDVSTAAVSAELPHRLRRDGARSGKPLLRLVPLVRVLQQLADESCRCIAIIEARLWRCLLLPVLAVVATG
jgi:hypothetical protein